MRAGDEFQPRRSRIAPNARVLLLKAISYDLDDRTVGAFDMHFLSDVQAFAFETVHGQGR